MNHSGSAGYAVVESRDNALFKRVRRLAQSARERKKQGLMLLDGVHLLDAWLQAGGTLQKTIISATGVGRSDAARWLADHPAESLVVLSQPLYDEIAEDLPSGLIGLATIPLTRELQLNVDTVLLDGVQDPGNLGTLLRTAAAAGIQQVLLTPHCAQAWAPKTLRAGMGAQFVLQITEHADLVTFLHQFRGLSLGTDLAGDASVFEVDTTQGPIAWVFGNEGEGVSPSVLSSVRRRVRLPMPGQVESLNVSAAAAVCLFEMVRQRSQ